MTHSGSSKLNSPRLATEMTATTLIKNPTTASNGSRTEINTTLPNVTIKEEPEDQTTAQSGHHGSNHTDSGHQLPTSPDKTASRLPPKEEKLDKQLLPAPQRDMVGGKKDYIHNYGQLDPVPQNVTMNVRDIPSITPGVQTVAPPPMPEFSIPQQRSKKADSPALRTAASGLPGAASCSNGGSLPSSATTDKQRPSDSSSRSSDSP